MCSLVATERQGKNELTLYKLETPRRTWSRGPMCHYELVYCWHNSETENTVQGSDVILATKREVASVLKGGSLFDAFNLF